ncbi:hypothetical protein GE061_001707 [Apolygus lucorum]|uniref:Uncharacterized protein n=1 Tax=Apolygus lucorum TaxID=248454 RepID=A0A6A4KBU8_APOLU|nr:hypothetical protein GE061_001707 [Apolygus lucorum]
MSNLLITMVIFIIMATGTSGKRRSCSGEIPECKTTEQLECGKKERWSCIDRIKFIERYTTKKPSNLTITSTNVSVNVEAQKELVSVNGPVDGQSPKANGSVTVGTEPTTIVTTDSNLVEESKNDSSPIERSMKHHKNKKNSKTLTKHGKHLKTKKTQRHHQASWSLRRHYLSFLRKDAKVYRRPSKGTNTTSNPEGHLNHHQNLQNGSTNHKEHQRLSMKRENRLLTNSRLGKIMDSMSPMTKSRLPWGVLVAIPTFQQLLPQKRRRNGGKSPYSMPWYRMISLNDLKELRRKFKLKKIERDSPFHWNKHHPG